MGKSNSIQNAEKANADFRKFLLDIQENLTEKFNREEEVFEKKVQEFYTSSGYDMLMVAEGHKWSYHLMSECGVAMLKNRVKEMVEAFFGVAEGEIPEGNVEIDKTPNGKVSVPASEEVLKALNIIRFFKNLACNSVQREHDKKLNNGLPILHMIPPYRDYGRYFCIQAGKGGTIRPGLIKYQAHFLYPKQEVLCTWQMIRT